jgi:hypothetical protein
MPYSLVEVYRVYMMIMMMFMIISLSSCRFSGYDTSDYEELLSCI